MDRDIKDEVKKIKPVQIKFEDKLREDKVFLLSLIDDPAKTFRIYGYDSDDRMLNMLNSMAANIRKRAVMVFTEILGMSTAAKGCEACDGCRVCKVCTTLMTQGMRP